MQDLTAIIVAASLNHTFEDTPAQYTQPADEPYVAFVFNEEVEPDAESWLLTGVQLLPDMRLSGEPVRCFVTLKMIGADEDPLAKDMVLEFDTFPIHYGGHWMDAKKVEEVLKDTNCLTDK